MLRGSAPVLAKRKQGMAHVPMAQGTDGGAPSTEAYRRAMTKMHPGTDIPHAGNADRDFVAVTIPHCHGAVQWLA